MKRSIVGFLLFTFLCSGERIFAFDGFVYPVGDPLTRPTSNGTMGNGYQETLGFAVGMPRHLGVDLANGAEGGEVRAVFDGVVVHRQDSTTGWGHMVRISHILPDGSEIYSQYAHLLTGTIEIEAGESVTTGQVIGYVDCTGNTRSTQDPPILCDSNNEPGPHLHFEIKYIDRNGCGYLPASSFCPWHETLSEYESPLDFIETHLDLNTGRGAEYLSFVEGSPGLPGDGQTVQAIGGQSTLLFELFPSFSLAGMTDGITVSVFFAPPSPATENFLLAVGLADMAPPCSTTTTLGTFSEAGSPIVANGVGGTALLFLQKQFDVILDFFNSALPNCDLTVDDLRVVQLGEGGSPVPTFREGGTSAFAGDILDAAAIGLGQGVLPAGATPSLAAASGE